MSISTDYKKKEQELAEMRAFRHFGIFREFLFFFELNYINKNSNTNTIRQQETET